MSEFIPTEPGLPAGLALLGLLALLALAGWINVRRIEKAHPPGGHFITIDGVRLHYRETGPQSGPVTLVLHGAASNLEEPHAAMGETFARERVIWLDRPGLGWSQRPRGTWSPKQEAALIAAFLDALDIRSAVVIGHSWGGAIAMRLAIEHPERVDGLVLLAPALSAWIGRAAWFNSASFWPILGPLITHIIVPLAGPSQARSGAIAAFHPEPMPERYVQDTALSLLLRPATWQANARDMARVNWHLQEQEAHYETLDHPTIVIAGKADTVLWSHRHGAHVAKRMRRAEMRWISGAGHNLHHHHPALVLQAVQDVRDQLRETGVKTGAAG